MFGRIARALLGRCGFAVGARRLGRCGECGTYVYDDDKHTRVHGVVFHRDCACYRGRVKAA